MTAQLDFLDTMDSGVVAARIRIRAVTLLAERGCVTADDLHAGMDFGARDSRIIGAVLRGLVSSGVARISGYRLSSRRECHGRPIAVFERSAT